MFVLTSEWLTIGDIQNIIISGRTKEKKTITEFQQIFKKKKKKNFATYKTAPKLNMKYKGELKSLYDDVLSAVDDFLWLMRSKHYNTKGRSVRTTRVRSHEVGYIDRKRFP